MGESIELAKLFLNEFSNESSSPTSEENIHCTIVGNYPLNINDVSPEVFDWVINFVTNRRCPYHLAVEIAKKTAQEINSYIATRKLEQNDSEENLGINAVTLYTETINKLQSVCQSFLNDEANLEAIFTSPLPYLSSIFAIRNKRRKMEDRHVILHNLNTLFDIKDAPPLSYYAVFDGHSGVDAASYVSAHLHINMVHHPSFLTDPVTAIKEAYHDTDENFMKMAKTEGIKSGCTALSALIKEKTIYLSWLGDSQAILVKKGQPISIMKPHKPEREDERNRIEKLGGYVTHFGTWRVNGHLAVSRAFGDADYKPYVSSEPEINVITMDGDEDFLILACDGLWDGLSPEEVASSLYHNLTENPLDNPVDTLAANLVHKSKLQGSDDNITTLVIFLNDINRIIETAKNITLLNFDETYTFQIANGEDTNKLDKFKNPMTKPNVLELNSFSSTKLKNTANILNMDYFCNTSPSKDSIGASGDATFQNVHSDLITSNDFLESENLKSGYAMGPTALSELPTPPIDGIIASQHMEAFCAAQMNEGLNISQIEPELVSQVQPLISFGANELTSNVTSLIQNDELLVKNEVDSTFNMQSNTFTEISQERTPVKENLENALDFENKSPEILASENSSILNTDESPVSVTRSISISSNLNPYAEPFVMKSFISDYVSSETTTEEKTRFESAKVESQKINSILTSDISNEIEVKSEIDNPKEIISENISKLEDKDSSKISEECELSDHLGFISTTENVSAINIENSAIKENILDTKEMNLMDIPLAPKVCEEFKNNSLCTDTHSEDKSNIDFTSDAKNSDNFSGENDTYIHSNPSQDNLEDKISNLNISNIQNEHDEKLYKEIDSEKNSNIIPSNDVESKSLLVDIENNQTDTSITINQNIIDNENIYHDLPKDVLEENIKNLELGHIETSKENLLNSPFIPENPQINVPGTLDTSLDWSTNIEILAADLDRLDINKDIISDQNIIEQNIKPETTEEIKSENVSNLVTIDSAMKDNNVKEGEISSNIITTETLIKMQEHTTEHVVEEQHLTSYAVDLKTVPESVPEAEGVTEDIDSDSEKDGGWSYMKVSSANNKNKSTEKVTSQELNSELKNDKPKIDSSKPISSMKNKTNVATLGDKNKLPNAVKKSAETKEVTKKFSKSPALPSTNTLPKQAVNQKSNRQVASTVTRTKKDVNVTSSEKVSALTMSSKSMRTTSDQNKPTLAKFGLNLNKGAAEKSKPNLPLPNRNISSRTISSKETSNQDKSTRLGGVSSAPTRATSNQNKNIVSSKTATLSAKSTLDTKPKSSNIAASKTSPSVPIKKADIKETKNTVNKQISAGKTLTSMQAKKSTLSTVAKTNTAVKQSATQVNKTLTTKITSHTSSRISSNSSTKVASNPSSRVASNPSAKVASNTYSKSATTSRVASNPTSRIDIKQRNAAQKPSSKGLLTKNTLPSKTVKNEVKEKTKLTEMHENSDKINMALGEMGDTAPQEIITTSGEEKFLLENNLKENIDDVKKKINEVDNHECCAQESEMLNKCEEIDNLVSEMNIDSTPK